LTTSSITIPDQLEPHPLAEKLPPLTGDEYRDLKSLITHQGQRDAITLIRCADGQLRILDGRHRYRILRELGRVPVYQHFEDLGLDMSPAEFVQSSESGRQMTPDKAACTAVKLREDLAQQGTARKARTQAVMASFFGVGEHDIRRATTLRNNAEDLFETVFRGDPGPNQHKPLTLSAANTLYNTRRRVAAGKAQLAEAPALEVLAPDAAELIVGDALEELRKRPAGSARLIFADIPYNLGVDYDGDGGAGDDLDEDDYLDAWRDVIDEAHRVLSDDGSLLLMTASRHVGPFAMWLTGQRPSVVEPEDSSDTSFEVEFSRPWHLRRVIAWHEAFATYQQGNYADAWRPIFWATKHATEYVFNADAIRVPSARQEQYGDKRADPAGRVPGSVWDFPRVAGTHLDRVPVEPGGGGGNANQLPLALVERVVLGHSDPGDAVVDFCNGGGTTGLASLLHGRRYVGIDRNPKAIDGTRDRLRLELASKGGSP
jgi:DNA modification methylase